MRQRTNGPVQQLGLCLERQHEYPLAEEIRESVVQALADLLLEAIGTDVSAGQSERGSRDELEDKL